MSVSLQETTQELARGHGLFVTFEGIDGSGKTTQMALCAEALEKAGHAVLVTRNPGGTELGAELRNILLHHPGHVSPTAELLLYMADRAQHMDEIVVPALRENKIVLCDRHLDSTVAYQGHGRSLDLDLIQELNRIATHGRKPDLTLLFDGPPERLAERIAQRGNADRLEREKIEFHQRVRQGYLTLAQAEPDRVRVFNALEDIGPLHQQVMNCILTGLRRFVQ